MLREALRITDLGGLVTDRVYALCMARPAFVASEALSAAGLDSALLRKLMPRVDPDHVMVRVAHPWFSALWGKRIVGVCMAWGIYVRPHIEEIHRRGEQPARIGRLIAHELMHLEQWRRLGALGHGVQYVGDYLRGRVAGQSHWEAYRAIRLEREARQAARLLMANPA